MRERRGIAYPSVGIVCPCHLRSARAYERRVTNRSVVTRNASNSSCSTVVRVPACAFRSRRWWRPHGWGGSGARAMAQSVSSLRVDKSATTSCHAGLRSSSMGGKLPQIVWTTTSSRGRWVAPATRWRHSQIASGSWMCSVWTVIDGSSRGCLRHYTGPTASWQRGGTVAMSGFASTHRASCAASRCAQRGHERLPVAPCPLVFA